MGYWLKAGQQAIARSAMTEAVAQLQKGLDLLKSMPDDPARQQQELDLRITLGQALTATKGWGSPLGGETYARAHLLAEQLDGRELLAGEPAAESITPYGRQPGCRERLLTTRKIALEVSNTNERVYALQSDRQLTDTLRGVYRR